MRTFINDTKYWFSSQIRDVDKYRLIEVTVSGTYANAEAQWCCLRSLAGITTRLDVIHRLGSLRCHMRWAGYLDEVEPLLRALVGKPSV